MEPHSAVIRRIRKVKTVSGSIAVQVGNYQGNRFKLAKHIGSAKDPQGISELMAMAREYIRSRSPQLEFDFNPQSPEILFKRGIRAASGRLEAAAVNYARRHLGFDFSLVFYDVTTLYFETHGQDELRRNGFSKDNKINQPQILIGLVVNNTGFPVYWNIFKGNTFEGKTMIPVISAIKEKYRIGKFTVVADAGMLSAKNLAELERHGIDYLVAARAKTLKLFQAQSIAAELNQTDQKIIRRESVLYEYSAKRAAKDKADNDKQLDKARYYLNNPSKAAKRSKFLSPAAKNNFVINESIVKKYRLLEGVKGYQTNVQDSTDRLLVDRYQDLWRIEQSFRIVKSDLEIRPVYHRREISIKAHVLIVFMALCLSRVIELETGKSVKRVMDELKDKWTITLTDDISGNTLDITLDTV